MAAILRGIIRTRRKGSAGRLARKLTPAWAFLAWLIPASAVCADNLSVFDPVSPGAESIRELFFLVLAITGAIFLLVEGALFYCVFRFRRRAMQAELVGAAEAETRAEPPQLYGSMPVELAWTVAPLLVVFVLFLVVVRKIVEIRRHDEPPGAIRVTVVGHQWWWEYRYPELGVTTANELHIPTSASGHARPVHLDLESADVVHSFWVPRLEGKTDLIPGQTNRMWFQTDQAGTYLGQCAEFCGTQHANMLLRVVAEPPEAFTRWAENERAPAVEDASAAAGRKLFLSLACVNCHTLRGTIAAGTAGPDLTHLMSRQTIGSTSIPNDRENLLRWVLDPQPLKPGCLMPSLHLARDEAERVVDFLTTLK